MSTTGTTVDHDHDLMQTLESEVGLLIRRIKRVICVRAQQVHPELQSGAYSILATLADVGPRRSSVIAETFHVDKGAVSRQVQQLVDLGLAERVPDPDDGRASIIRVTDEGDRRLTAVSTRRRRILSERLGSWSETDLESFVRLLARYNETLDLTLD
ncbi:MAG: MarR family winged helix-turn-helix transcriptional regulator [Marmoricola sp.]